MIDEKTDCVHNYEHDQFFDVVGNDNIRIKKHEMVMEYGNQTCGYHGCGWNLEHL